MQTYILNIVPTNKEYLAKITLFLQQHNLAIDNDFVEFIIFENSDLEIIASAAIASSGIIKCVAIDTSLQGDGILLELMTEVLKTALRINCKKLFIYTKQANEIMFKTCGFTVIVRVKNDFVLMENNYQPITEFCHNLALTKKEGSKIGSIIMNANPFTLGHQYLVRQASQQCEWLHVFVLKEELSYFKFQDRLNMVIAGCAEFNNVTIHAGGDYIISRLTFPSYFLKKPSIVDEYYIEIDLQIFRQYIAPALNINYRFVGSEPNCQLTQKYNQKMQQFLTSLASNLPVVQVIELPRLETKQGLVISASEVRKRLQQRNNANLSELLPFSSINYLNHMDKLNLS